MRMTLVRGGGSVSLSDAEECLRLPCCLRLFFCCFVVVSGRVNARSESLYEIFGSSSC
jgi:hypothetical protein